jgi:uncharacterized membrane protein YgdD (TMEM256/DUF423 family)
MISRMLKLLHQLGAIGMMGALAACVVLVAVAPRESLVEYAAFRQGIEAVTRILLVPSLALVLVSGLLAIAVNRAYHNAGWAWIKAVLGIVMFEGTLLTIQASARRAAELSALAASTATPDPAALEPLLRTERGGLWLMLVLCFGNVVLAIWRPHIGPRRS